MTAKKVVYSQLSINVDESASDFGTGAVIRDRVHTYLRERDCVCVRLISGSAVLLALFVGEHTLLIFFP